MQIAGRMIGRTHAPYVIAEMSANHCRKIERAFKIMDAAKEAGADAIKFQYYDPLVLAEARGGPRKKIKTGPWAGRTLYDLYTEAATPALWFPRLAAHAQDIGLTWFSSVFAPEDVGFLDIIGAPAFKVSSFEMTRQDLVRAAANTGKPLILSTGMGDDTEVGTAVGTAMDGSLADIALLHCVSAYPCPIDKANLSRISNLAYRFGLPVGWSDHTIGATSAVAAVALGACIVEKHLTLADDMGSLDAAFSATPVQFRDLVTQVQDAWAACQASLPVRPYADLKVVA